MPRALRSAEFKFTARDRRRLADALKLTREARHYKRLQAVLLVAGGKSVNEVARLTGATRQSVYNWARRYAGRRRADALRDTARAGRPRAASDLTDERVLEELRRDPLALGYSTQVWTVALLARHLSGRCGCAVTPRTLRRRMRAAGLRWKRPRYVLTGRDEHAPQKKGR
jgi:transposase